MKNQEDIFKEGEGDAWFSRNRDALISGSRIDDDPALQLMRSCRMPMLGTRVLEVGASNGWRLNELLHRGARECYGVDVSKRAILDGRRRYTGLHLRVAKANKLPFADEAFDIVIVNFVLHWVARESLLSAMSKINRVLRTDGRLIITDFLPRRHQKIRYHHIKDRAVYTFTTDYPRLFLDTGMYRQAHQIVFDSSNPLKKTRIKEIRRASASLLCKVDQYREAKLF